MLTAAVAGIGNSIFHPADFTLLIVVLRSRGGHAFSVHGLSGNLGWAARRCSWRHCDRFRCRLRVFCGRGRRCGPCRLFWRRTMLTNAAAELVVRAIAHAGLKVAGDYILLFYVNSRLDVPGIFFFSTAAFGILQNYSPAILGNVYGMSLVLATGSLTAYLLGSAAGTITGGFLASRNERNERLIAIALGFSALMALLLASGQIGAALAFPVMA